MPRQLAILLGAFLYCLPIAGAFAGEPSSVEISSSPAQRALSVSPGAPLLANITPMQVVPGGTADQDIQATDSEGDAVSFLKGAGPDYMTVQTLDAGSGTATGRIHLEPPADAVIERVTASVVASDGVLQDELAFLIYASNVAPTLEQPENMTVEPWHQGDQVLHANDPDQDPLTFSLVNGPDFVYVKTTGPGLGDVRLTPARADSGTYQVSVAVSDGIASQGRTFAATVLAGTIPIMDALSDMTVSPGQVARQSLNGGDLDGDVLHFSKVSGPSFMTVVGGGKGQAGGYITLSPTLADDPTGNGGDYDYPATVSLSDGRFSVSRSFTVHIHFYANRPPVLEQPADIHVEEGSAAFASLSYSDPDPEPLSASLTKGPAFASLRADSPTGAYLFVNPGLHDAGTYLAKVRVTDSRGLYDEKAFLIVVSQDPRPPTFQVPMDMLVFAGRTAEQDLHATDPEGHPITFWTIPGLCPDYVTVQTIDPGSGSALGRVRVAPAESDVGRRDFVNVLVSNGAIFNEAYILVEVADPSRLALMHTYNPCVAPGDSTVVWFLAADPDGKPVTFQLSGMLPWMTFVDHGDGSASLVLQPTPGDAGGNFMTISATNGTSVLTEAFAVNVGYCGLFAGEDGSPASAPGGPYAGFVGTPVAFNGSQSSDPDGHPLTMAWNFGDGSVAFAASPEHTYSRSGQFQVDLIVSDGVRSGRSSTTASIANALAARVVAGGAQSKVGLNATSAPLRIWLEPGEGFHLSDIDLESLSLVYENVEPSDAIHGEADSSPAIDRDGNGKPEIGVSFRKDDLRSLLSSVAAGADVDAAVSGRTLVGTPFRAAFLLTVTPGRGKVAAVLYPNPLNPGGTLSFTTHQTGPAHVSVFDLQGRLVRTLLSSESTPAGYHEVRLDGRDGGGAKLASGVYFYRIETPGDVTSGRFAVLK